MASWRTRIVLKVNLLVILTTSDYICNNIRNQHLAYDIDEGQRSFHIQNSFADSSNVFLQNVTQKLTLIFCETGKMESFPTRDWT